MKNGKVASAKGAKLRLTKARSPLRLGILGSVVSSASGVWGGPGGAPENDAILNILCQNGVLFWFLLISYFLTIKSKKASKPYRPMKKFHHIIYSV